jgi:hypothetical protein
VHRAPFCCLSGEFLPANHTSARAQSSDAVRRETATIYLEEL